MNSEIPILNTNNNMNCIHNSYSLIEEYNEIENDSIKYTETYMCDNCHTIGYLIYYVPNEIIWIDNSINL